MKNPTTGQITLGHYLFTQWSCERGAQQDNPDRPTSACLEEIRRELNRRCGDITRFRFIRTIHGMWYWLDSSPSPTKPRLAYRRGIKRITAGHVPIDAWDLVYDPDKL